MNLVCFAKIPRYDAVRQHPSHENPLVTIASYRATPETRAAFARSFIIPECAGPRTVYHRVHPLRNDVRILLREADPGDDDSLVHHHPFEKGGWQRLRLGICMVVSLALGYKTKGNCHCRETSPRYPSSFGSCLIFS